MLQSYRKDWSICNGLIEGTLRLADPLSTAPEMLIAVYLSSSGPFCGPNNNAGSTNIYMLSVTSKDGLPPWQNSPILIDSKNEHACFEDSNLVCELQKQFLRSTSRNLAISESRPKAKARRVPRYWCQAKT